MNKEIYTPRTEGIKYAGSKLKILPHIIAVLSQLQDVEYVLDGFSGTTRVSQAFAQLNYHTTSNDIAIWSEVLATCYLKSEKEDKYYQEILSYLNALDGYEGWFTHHYGGDINDKKKPFQRKNTKKLDAIRDAIEELQLDWVDKTVILTSLIYALDEVDSTLGHYASYLSTWSSRSFKDIFLRLPQRFPLATHNEVIRNNIFDVVQERAYDLVYFDPPYGSNNDKMPSSRIRYNSYYHIWKTVILHDKPDVFGKANRRVDSKDSYTTCPFEEYKKDSKGNFVAMNALNTLISSAKTRYILLSYSSGGRVPKTALLDILHTHGKLIYKTEIDYKRNVMSTMCSTHQWSDESTGHKELLFLLEK
ncbi:MAG: DNA adenine methylase [Desulfovibrionaceae bacterium]|nr:DNA adenine methylase [Desulfovibrionaceae bacterium]